jgi:hypothetical protein
MKDPRIASLQTRSPSLLTKYGYERQKIVRIRNAKIGMSYWNPICFYIKSTTLSSPKSVILRQRPVPGCIRNLALVTCKVVVWSSRREDRQSKVH